jgi:hypothetical protein
MTINRPEVITIIDFSLPSHQERLWVLDLVEAKVLYHCLVSHGRNSGEIMAENFPTNQVHMPAVPVFIPPVKPILGNMAFPSSSMVLKTELTIMHVTVPLSFMVQIMCLPSLLKKMADLAEVWVVRLFLLN